MSSRSPSGPNVRRLALTAEQVGVALGVSRATVWRMHASGRLPAPVRFGRAVRWEQYTIEEWLAAGAPSREQWEALCRRHSS